jgi:outer membrane protein
MQLTFSSIKYVGTVNVFSGGIINHSIKPANWNLQAAIADAERSINDLGLLIASAYLNILLSEEQLNNAGKRVGQSGVSPAGNHQKLIDAGTAPAAEKFNLLAQVARDKSRSPSRPEIMLIWLI